MNHVAADEPELINDACLARLGCLLGWARELATASRQLAVVPPRGQLTT